MREILFRGKRVDNGEWVEGYYELCGYLVGTIEEDIYPTITPFNKYKHEVDPNTVGQWTGAYDKNDKRIFEGDIVDVDGVVYACRWDDGNLEFCLVNEKESFGIVYVVPYVEVIGNIYDNPELLEV